MGKMGVLAMTRPKTCKYPLLVNTCMIYLPNCYCKQIFEKKPRFKHQVIMINPNDGGGCDMGRIPSL